MSLLRVTCTSVFFFFFALPFREITSRRGSTGPHRTYKDCPVQGCTARALKRVDQHLVFKHRLTISAKVQAAATDGNAHRLRQPTRNDSKTSKVKQHGRRRRQKKLDNKVPWYVCLNSQCF
ncbi:hypothetical protein HOLleu_35748 [Holothuria leucospilota]|uniref:Secreted protein n=1 Tax=Holothuria leucospilota TaxID=206669 RepID=A0A9Q0YNB2_HOLLE|nr:hypothetical protein HOLleu_35748 [Holothuria leucospilota]